ncbi:MAG: spore protease YyaC [Firmicutes bacterium]|nr:spore protease YyaC [Bacillota bacterium]
MSDSQLLGRVHWNDPLAVDYLSLTIANLPLSDSVTIVCVGTDRSTGDCLGPLVGTQLMKEKARGRLASNVTIYGTLDEPVHALNLSDYARRLVGREHRSSTIIALDACLGRSKSIGYISVKQGPLQPGTGVNKQLPSVGDYHIIGIVNVSGFMEHVVLQNTRLSLVMRMAEVISRSLVIGLSSSSVPASREAALSAHVLQ